MGSHSRIAPTKTAPAHGTAYEKGTGMTRLLNQQLLAEPRPGTSRSSTGSHSSATGREDWLPESVSDAASCMP
jgi:hypothetical protein